MPIMSRMWTNILKDLKDKTTDKYLADQAGLTVSSIRRLRNGDIAEPKHSAGEAILNVHKRFYPPNHLSDNA